MIQAAHRPEHFRRVEGAFENGLEMLDADTVISMQSFDAAMFAAGGVCRAVDAVMTGEAKMRLSRCVRRDITRPPKARWVFVFSTMSRLPRVTRRIVTRKSSVWRLLIGTCITATERREFSLMTRQFIFSRCINIRGIREQAVGAKRVSGAEKVYDERSRQSAYEGERAKRMFEASIEDISANFKPDLIIISAGFDGHLTDPLGQLRLEDDDYVSMTETLKDWADETCGGRMVSALEGGYNLETLGGTVKITFAP